MEEAYYWMSTMLQLIVIIILSIILEKLKENKKN